MARKLLIGLAAVIAVSIIAVAYKQRTRAEDAQSETTEFARTGGSPTLKSTARNSSDGMAQAPTVNIPGDALEVSAKQENKLAIASKGASAPIPMSIENMQRVSRFADGLATTNVRQKEFLTLARNEEKDPLWSPQMQEAIASSLRNNYGQRTGLELSDVECTRSICALSAVALSSTAPTYADDWQAVMGSVLNEPWFKDQFFDVSTTMGADEKGLIYVTYLVRKTGE